jgi:hypothetical protein
MLIATVNGITAAEHPFSQLLLDAGFMAGAMGFHLPRSLSIESDARHKREIPAHPTNDDVG